MITPEQLIADLTKQNEKLRAELLEAQQDIKDFERAAIEWKDGYADMEKNYRVKLANAKETIGQLEGELEEAKLTILRLKP